MLILLILLVYITRSCLVAGRRIRDKLWLLNINYCQNDKAQWKNLRAFLKLLDTITVYLLFLFLFIFCVLFIFSVNKFLLTIVNKNFLKIKCFKLFFSCRSSSLEVLSQRRVFYGCAADFRGPICSWVWF